MLFGAHKKRNVLSLDKKKIKRKRKKMFATWYNQGESALAIFPYSAKSAFHAKNFKFFFPVLFCFASFYQFKLNSEYIVYQSSFDQQLAHLR